MGVLVMFCFLARVLVIYHCLCKFIEQCIFDVYILEMIQAEKYYVVIEIIKCDLFDSNNDSSVDKEFACNAGDPSLIPGLGRSTREGIGYPLQYPWASLVTQLIKNPPAKKRKRKRIHLQCGRPGFDPWVGKIPWRRERLPTPVFWPGEFHGLYSPWDHKELDITK